MLNVFKLADGTQLETLYVLVIDFAVDGFIDAIGREWFSQLPRMSGLPTAASVGAWDFLENPVIVVFLHRTVFFAQRDPVL